MRYYISRIDKHALNKNNCIVVRLSGNNNLIYHLDKNAFVYIKNTQISYILKDSKDNELAYFTKPNIYNPECTIFLGKERWLTVHWPYIQNVNLGWPIIIQYAVNTAQGPIIIERKFPYRHYYVLFPNKWQLIYKCPAFSSWYQVDILQPDMDINGISFIIALELVFYNSTLD